MGNENVGMYANIQDKGDPFARMAASGIDPVLMLESMGIPREDAIADMAKRGLVEGSDGQGAGGQNGAPIVENDNGAGAGEGNGAAAEPKTQLEHRRAVRALNLSEDDKGTLMEQIEAAANATPKNVGGINEALGLIGDNAELLAKRFDEMDETDVANALISLADSADALSEDESVSEADKHSRGDVMLAALIEATKQFETAIDKGDDDDDDTDGKKMKERKKSRGK